MNTHEGYIVNLIKLLESELIELKKAYTKNDLSKFDYQINFHRIAAQKDILHMVLTAHDNSLSKLSPLYKPQKLKK